MSNTSNTIDVLGSIDGTAKTMKTSHFGELDKSA